MIPSSACTQFLTLRHTGQKRSRISSVMIIGALPHGTYARVIEWKKKPLC
jgi:hypothetical protein